MKRALYRIFAVSILCGLSGIVFISMAVGEAWTNKADMLNARSDLSTVVLDGKIYAIGGREQGDTIVVAIEECELPTTKVEGFLLLTFRRVTEEQKRRADLRRNLK